MKTRRCASTVCSRPKRMLCCSTTYKVNLIVRALSAGYARLISLRLKEGFVASDDVLEMRTSVYVQNPKVFCECMKWKHKEVEQKWKVYYDMAPAVD
ncbi:hypothetical protein Pcac1_g14703 [Phytophthora cactorum]|nr:hypothetical protein Pcac1_g14703 [Phytophthora cactorum]